MNDKQPAEITLTPIGYVRSPYKQRADLPRFDEIAQTQAILDIDASYAEGLANITPGDRLMVLFNFHLSREARLTVHIRGTGPLTGVFSTHSPDRPNFIGVTNVQVESIDGTRLVVRGVDMLDGTPILDLKPAPK